MARRNYNFVLAPADDLDLFQNKPQKQRSKSGEIGQQVTPANAGADPVTMGKSDTLKELVRHASAMIVSADASPLVTESAALEGGVAERSPSAAVQTDPCELVLPDLRLHGRPSMNDKPRQTWANLRAAIRQRPAYRRALAKERRSHLEPIHDYFVQDELSRITADLTHTPIIPVLDGDAESHVTTNEKRLIEFYNTYNPAKSNIRNVRVQLAKYSADLCTMMSLLRNKYRDAPVLLSARGPKPRPVDLWLSVAHAFRDRFSQFAHVDPDQLKVKLRHRFDRLHPQQKFQHTSQQLRQRARTHGGVDGPWSTDK